MRRLYRMVAVTALGSVALLALPSWADEVRYYQQNGITYCETTRKVPQVVYETTYQDQPQTVYRDKVCQGHRDMLRITQVPVTQYVAQNRWVGRWNPFVQPYQVQHLVPVTRLQQRVEPVQLPCTRVDRVAENVTVKVPVLTQRTVDRDVVVSRVAVNTAPPMGPATAPVYATAPFNPAAPAAVPGATVQGPPTQPARIGGIQQYDQFKSR